MEERKITKKQTQLLHIGKAKLQLSEDQYRLMLSDYWVQSSVDLTYQEASDLLNKMVKMGFKIVTKRYEHKKLKKPNKPDNIINLVSPQQLAKIEHLRADIRWHVHDGYFRWLKKWLKKDKISTSRDASSVIEGLKGMLARQQRTQETQKTQETQETQETGLRRDGGFHGGRWQW